MNTTLHVGVIADDFTGAMDTGVMFAIAGYETQFRRNDIQVESQPSILVMSTDSREAPAAFAIAQVNHVASKIRQRRLFKKIDSTMRGNIGVEIDALLTATGIATAVICPTAPDVGRSVKDGQLLVAGDLLHQTAFAQDPHWPATTASMITLAQHGSVKHFDLNIVRGGSQSLAEALLQAEVKLVTMDAVTYKDLAIIAEAVIAANCLPCGSKGLAAAWIQALGSQKVSPALPQFPAINEPLLIVAGSRHPATERQLSLLGQQLDIETCIVHPGMDSISMQQRLFAALAQYPVVVLRTTVDFLADTQAVSEVNQNLGKLTRAASRNAGLGGLMLIGGETAAHVCKGLGIEGIHIMGEIAAGVPVGQIIGGSANLLPVITKAGGFGDDNVLVFVVEWCQRDISNRDEGT